MIPYGPHRNHASGLLYPLKKKKKKKKKKKGGQGACAEVGGYGTYRGRYSIA
jgi:hypothetical protein